MIAELLILLPVALEKGGGNAFEIVQKSFGKGKTTKMDLNIGSGLQEADSTTFGGLEFKKYF